MANEPETPPTNPESGSTTETPDAEETFWQKFDKRVEAVIDRKVKQFRDGQGTSTTRGTGRTTIPKILADFMFGPEKKNE